MDTSPTDLKRKARSAALLSLLEERPFAQILHRMAIVPLIGEALDTRHSAA